MTKAEYQQTLAEMKQLMNSEPDRRSPDGRRLESLAAVAEVYEVRQFGPPSMDIESR